MANGKFAGGDGTKENPYLIEDAFDLDEVRNNLSASYKLIRNIDLNVNPFNKGEGWKPIGANIYQGFKGNFDGNGFCIKNLQKSGNYPGGLFSDITDSNVENLGIINVKITQGYHSSALTGECANSNVINCFVSGVIDVDAPICGGLLSQLTTGNVLNCLSSCDVKGKSNVGGLIGYIYQQNFTIKNCYSSGKVISTLSERYGGLIGFNNYDKYNTIINSYWDINLSGQSSSAGGEGKTTEQMKNPSTFIGWANEKTTDGKNVWILKEGEYPKLHCKKMKFLLEQNNQYYSLKSEFYEPSKSQYMPITKVDNNITNEDLKKYGFDDIGAILIETTIGDEKFKPIDKLKLINDGKFNILTKELD